MFVTKEKIKERTGYDVDGTTLALAQMMIEAWVGKIEEDVTDAGDMALLERATTFQAVYIVDSPDDVLQQMSVKNISQGDSQFVMDTEVAAPFMSRWAVMTCRKLSWVGTRTIHTGPIFDSTPSVGRWDRY